MDSIREEPSESGPVWLSKLVEILQPLTVRADQLRSMPLFAGFRWSELETLAAFFEEAEIGRGTRVTAQGRPTSRLLLIVEGEALVSADARPLRVSGHGDAVGVAGMLYGIKSPETTIALSPIRALAAGPPGFRELVARPTLRRRLTAVAGDQLRSRRLSQAR